MSNIQMLRGVQTLHLCLSQCFKFVPSAAGQDSEAKEVENSMQADLESILRLRALSVKHVTVVMSDRPEMMERYGIKVCRWTTARKIEFAEKIRSQLMDPSGAQLVTTEVEAAKLARKIEIKDNARHRLDTYRSILKSKQEDVVRSAKCARRTKARAVLMLQEASQALKQGSKRAAKLQDAAEKQEKSAICTKLAADREVKTEQYWQQEVAHAREMYEKAMARLGESFEDTEDVEEAERLSGSVMNSEEANVTQANEEAQSQGDELLASHSDEDPSAEDKSLASCSMDEASDADTESLASRSVEDASDGDAESLASHSMEEASDEDSEVSSW